MFFMLFNAGWTQPDCEDSHQVVHIGHDYVAILLHPFEVDMVAMVMIMTMTMMVITMTHPLLLLPFEGAATIVVDNEIRSQVHTGCPSLAEGFHNDVDAGDSDDQDEDDDLLYLNSGPVTAPQAVPGKRARGRCSSTLMLMMMLMTPEKRRAELIHLAR